MLPFPGTSCSSTTSVLFQFSTHCTHTGLFRTCHCRYSTKALTGRSSSQRTLSGCTTQAVTAQVAEEVKSGLAEHVCSAAGMRSQAPSSTATPPMPWKGPGQAMHGRVRIPLPRPWQLPLCLHLLLNSLSIDLISQALAQ